MEGARCLLLAAGPHAPGARETLQRALDAGDAPLEVMLTHQGLAWADDAGLRRAHEAGRARVALCTVAARDRGWTPQGTPMWIAWSGVAVWLLRHADAAAIGSVLP